MQNHKFFASNSVGNAIILTKLCVDGKLLSTTSCCQWDEKSQKSVLKTMDGEYRKNLIGFHLNLNHFYELYSAITNSYMCKYLCVMCAYFPEFTIHFWFFRKFCQTQNVAILLENSFFKMVIYQCQHYITICTTYKGWEWNNDVMQVRVYSVFWMKIEQFEPISRN